MMKLPQTFLSENKTLERKTEDLLKGYKKTDNLDELEILKEGKTRKEKEEFLKLFAEYLPCFIDKTKDKMRQVNTNTVYLDEVPEESKTRDEGYRTKLEIRHDGRLYFFYSLSGMTFKADLDNGFYSHNGYGPVYDFLSIYPGEDTSLGIHSEDFLDGCFKTGKEMYDCIKSFLRK